LLLEDLGKQAENYRAFLTNSDLGEHLRMLVETQLAQLELRQAAVADDIVKLEERAPSSAVATAS
jgi:hypothetical protein